MAGYADRALWVVKLGGSLAEGPDRLRAWLRAVHAGSGRTVVVPGGGPFADAVRHAQADLGFDDGAAHRMALLAMVQYGTALCAMTEGFDLAAGEAELRAVMAAGRIPVWAPCAMALAAPDIPESWDVTSDSLAAWLAGRLRAARLVLVKSAQRPPAGCTLAAAVRSGLVDRAMPDFVTSRLRVSCLGPGDEGLLAAALSGVQDFASEMAGELAAGPLPATAAVLS